MKNKRTSFLLFTAVLIASVAFAQAKRPQPEQPTSLPQTQVVTKGEGEVSPPEQHTVSDMPSDAGDTAAAGARPSSATGTASTADAQDWRFLTTIIVAALIFLLAVAAHVLQMASVTRKILAALPRGDEGRHDRDRVLKELAVVKNDTREQIATLRVAVEGIPDKVQQRVQKLLAKGNSSGSTSSSQQYETSERQRSFEDATPQLLTIANQVIQQTPTTLDAFRASTRQISVRVSAWPNAADGAPVAFIVEHRDSYYAIPNVVKPARLPPEWFNRAEFGVNDEIQRVVELPRLRRRGNEYDVAVPGVFGR